MGKPERARERERKSGSERVNGMSDMAGNAARVAVECGGRCRDTNHTSDILFKNKDDQFRTSAVDRPNS